MRATSSIRSSSRSMSKRLLGAVTCQPSAFATTCHAERGEDARDLGVGDLDAEHALEACTTQGHRLLAHAGRPGARPRSPGRPCRRRSRAAARSRARSHAAAASGSTPRSKRCEASVCRPSLRARPMIAAGAKCAASEEHVARRVGDARIVAAHHPGHGERAGLVGDQHEALVELRLVAVEQLERFAVRAHGARRRRPEACRCRTRAAAGRVRASRSW